MGIIKTDITLKNVKDIIKAEEGLIREEEIRQTTVEAMVDTGTGTLVINEELRRQLGLEVKGERQATLANDTKDTVKLAGLVEVHWKDRSMACQPLVTAGGGEVLLGAIPLEDMDLMVDPVRRVLTGAHGDEVVSMMK